MAMQMQRAFNSRMLTKMTKHSIAENTYDANNHVVEGEKVSSILWGVIVAGNKFSQFEEGQAIHSEDGGRRISDFRTLYITDKYSLEINDKLEFKGKFFNVLQQSDEAVYGFYSYLLEKSEEWTP